MENNSLFEVTRQSDSHHPGRYGYGRSASHRSEKYPVSWEGKTPKAVILVKSVRTWTPTDEKGEILPIHSEYEVNVNAHGLVLAYRKGKPPVALPFGSFHVERWWESDYA